MATSTTHRAQRVLIDFSSGPIHCRSCGAVMRPSEGITNGWPTSIIPYGRAGECKSCATQTKDEGRSTGEGKGCRRRRAAPLPHQSCSDTQRGSSTSTAPPFRLPAPDGEPLFLLRTPHQPPHWRVPVLRLTRQEDLHVHLHRRGHQRS